MLTIGSLFSGIGGLELGLEWAGLGPVLWQVERDEKCRRVLAKHWPNTERFEDVKNVGASTLVPVDVICGGFPCQDISNAGKKVGIEGTRSVLWVEYSRIVRELRPRFVVVENVAALVHRGLERVLRDLASLGYHAEWSCLSACAVGAPHARERLFLVAYSDAYGEPTRSVDAEMARLSTHAGAMRDRWLSEPSSLRMADGVPGGVDRLKQLGNAVVPQCAYVVGMRVRALLEAAP